MSELSTKEKNILKHRHGGTLPRTNYEELSEMTVQELAARQQEVKAAMDLVKSYSKKLTDEYERIRKTTLPELMQDQEIESIKVKGVGQVILTDDIYVHVPAANREALLKWLKANKLATLITTGVNPTTLKAELKRRLESGVKNPDDIVKVTPFTFSKVPKMVKAK
jgi:hypothetical protein